MQPLHRLLNAESTREFGAALSDLRAALGMSLDEFARELSRHHPAGKSWSKTFVNQLELGNQALVKPESMVALAEAAARVAGIEPTYFREYREHLAARRAAQLARKIGLDEVLAVLDQLDGKTPNPGPKRRR
jgi:transcriptional regulator with XRE-family HTH domain